jgi:hypothetical protein
VEDGKRLLLAHVTIPIRLCSTLGDVRSESGVIMDNLELRGRYCRLGSVPLGVIEFVEDIFRAGARETETTILVIAPGYMRILKVGNSSCFYIFEGSVVEFN